MAPSDPLGPSLDGDELFALMDEWLAAGDVSAMGKAELYVETVDPRRTPLSVVGVLAMAHMRRAELLMVRTGGPAYAAFGLEEVARWRLPRLRARADPADLAEMERHFAELREADLRAGGIWGSSPDGRRA